jgi:hypothetical protein
VTLAARLAGKPVVTTLHVSPQDDATFGEFIKERLAVRIRPGSGGWAGLAPPLPPVRRAARARP